jgi:carboxyl-terminal processing protease
LSGGLFFMIEYLRALGPLILIVSSLLVNAQQAQNFQKEFTLLKNTILKNHFNPRPIDDTFSAVVYDNLLNKLDPDKLYFTEADLKLISPYRTTIDNSVNSGILTFLPTVTMAYKKCLERSALTIEQLTQAPFDFNIKEVLYTDTSEAADVLENQNRWRQELKAGQLERLMELRGEDKTISDKDLMSKYESQTRQQIKLSKLRPINRILNHASGFESYVAASFFRAITLTFDPHSMYLSPTEMENFMASLSTEGYYFGLSVDENERGDVIISQLMPGGPAWKSGSIHTGDVIRGLQWDGKESVDIAGIDVEELETILSDANHSIIELTLSDVTGALIKVKLKKEKMADEESIVKSFILEGEQKIGYISLPGFYYDWGGGSGSNCANDVAKEIVKLKKENIEGIILDVRFNGGGSLNEAVAMAGIFIDAGPIGVLKDKNGELNSYKDMNRGTVWDGPLILMVNGLSASASEILAAALQDYHRAIIVGDQTFGKATAQNIFPLQAEEILTQSKPKSGLGYASVTIDKIYRVTGKTAQLKGVTPDIRLPDIFSHLKFREIDTPGALPSDSIQKKSYYQPQVLLPIAELRNKSEIRIHNNPSFTIIDKASAWFAERTNESKPVSLNWIDFKNDFLTQRSKYNFLNTTDQKSSVVFKVKNHAFAEQRMQMDEYVNGLTKAWVSKLEKDVSLEEAFYIICDYIHIKARK